MIQKCTRVKHHTSKVETDVISKLLIWMYWILFPRQRVIWDYFPSYRDFLISLEVYDIKNFEKVNENSQRAFILF